MGDIACSHCETPTLAFGNLSITSPRTHQKIVQQRTDLLTLPTQAKRQEFTKLTGILPVRSPFEDICFDLGNLKSPKQPKQKTKQKTKRKPKQTKTKQTKTKNKNKKQKNSYFNHESLRFLCCNFYFGDGGVLPSPLTKSKLGFIQPSENSTLPARSFKSWRFLFINHRFKAKDFFFLFLDLWA